MYRNAHRLLACLLSFLLIIDTASAGWLIGNCFRGVDPCDPCAVESCCVSSCQPVTSCCETSCHSSCEESSCGCETSSDCCDGESYEYVESENVAPTLADDHAHEPTPAPVMEVAPVPELESEGFSSAPIAEVTEPVELEAPPEPVENEFVEIVPAETVNEEPATFNEPEVMVEESTTEPEDDMFGGFDEQPAEVVEEMPAEEMAPMEEATEEAGDDLFGGFGDDNAMEEEAPMEEASDDLFGGFGEEAAPMEEAVEEVVEEVAPAVETVEEAADDLFGGFGEEEAPVEEATEEAGDDLFGGFGDDNAMEEEAPMEEASDDLFGGFGEEEAPMEEAVEEVVEEVAPAVETVEEAADDLFGGFAEEEAPMEETADEAADDLFGGFGEEEVEEAVEQTTEEAPAEGADEAFDDLFGGFSSVLQEPGGYQSDENRNWVDNTGSFSCVARLVSVDGNSVLLAKPTGKMATVPLSRLSQADLEFVNRQALAQQQVETVHMAQR